MSADTIRVAYIWASAIETCFMVAVAVYLASWWSVLPIVGILLSGVAFTKRMDLWTGSIQ